MIALLALLACSPCPDLEGACNPSQDVQTGDFVVTASSWEEVTGGDLAITDDDVTVEYVDEKGRTIRVRYARVE